MDIGFGHKQALFEMGEIEQIKAQLPLLGEQAGTRGLLGKRWCAALAREPRLLSLATDLLGASVQPVRAILFDKVEGRNWTLGWHQDTKIAVREAKDVPGFSGWSVKEGVTHTLPPLDILEQCVALRLHLDPCPADNGPLQVIPNSHLNGLRDYPSAEEIETAVTLTAEVGDVIWMRPLVFHGSAKSQRVDHRRVLHIEYSSANLPGGLEWAWAGDTDMNPTKVGV